MASGTIDPNNFTDLKEFIKRLLNYLTFFFNLKSIDVTKINENEFDDQHKFKKSMVILFMCNC